MHEELESTKGGNQTRYLKRMRVYPICLDDKIQLKDALIEEASMLHV